MERRWQEEKVRGEGWVVRIKIIMMAEGVKQCKDLPLLWQQLSLPHHPHPWGLKNFLSLPECLSQFKYFIVCIVRNRNTTISIKFSLIHFFSCSLYSAKSQQVISRFFSHTVELVWRVLFHLTFPDKWAGYWLLHYVTYLYKWLTSSIFYMISSKIENLSV